MRQAQRVSFSHTSAVAFYGAWRRHTNRWTAISFPKPPKHRRSFSFISLRERIAMRCLNCFDHIRAAAATHETTHTHTFVESRCRQWVCLWECGFSKTVFIRVNACARCIVSKNIIFGTISRPLNSTRSGRAFLFIHFLCVFTLLVSFRFVYFFVNTFLFRNLPVSVVFAE